MLFNSINFSYIIFSTNVSINDYRIMSLLNIIIINVFRLYFNIKILSKSCKKRNLNYNVDKCKSWLNDVLSINKNKLLNNEKFFEIIDKKTCQ